MHSTLGKTVALVFATILLLSSFQGNTHAEQSTDSTFLAKGKTAYSSHFSGIIIWTLVKDTKGTFVYHGLDGQLVVIRATLTQAECEQGSTAVCYDATVTNVKNAEPAFQVGDTFKLTIDKAANEEYISFLSGFFENVDVKISLTNIKTKTIKPTAVKEKQKI